MEAKPWMDQAWAEIGQREVGGAADNPRILAFYRDVGHADAVHDEVAWCAAFVGACLQRAGIASTQSLLARSYLNWGEPIAGGRTGAIAVFSRGSNASTGHVAFYLDGDATRVFVLGGNQDDAVTVTAIERDRLLGLRWPPASAAAKEAAATPTAFSSDSRPLFEIALGHVLEMEGGWTEDQYDPGGPTNFGITLGTLAAARCIVLDVTTFSDLREQLRRISMIEVRDIYQKRYWTPCRAEALHPAVALMHFDATVNHGLGASARMLQQAVGATIDGEIGPETLAACAAAAPATILQRYANERRERYRALSHFWRFGRDWLARVDATLKLALTLTTPQPEGERSKMTDNNATTPTAAATASTPPAKWWGQSMTMWGTLITAVSTVLPVLGPVIGIDISADLIRQLGTQGAQTVQAIGGLVGTLLTIYGRVRANTKLGLRSVTMQI